MLKIVMILEFITTSINKSEEKIYFIDSDLF